MQVPTPMPGSGDARPSQPELTWTVSKAPYALGVALPLICTLACLAFVVEKSKGNFLFFWVTLFLSFIGIRSLRVFLSGVTGYRLDSQGLTIQDGKGSTTIPLIDILYVESERPKSEAGAIRVQTRERLIVIPRFLSADKEKVRQTLRRHVRDLQGKRHGVRAELGQVDFPHYGDAPAELLELAKNLYAQQSVQGAQLFRGPYVRNSGCLSMVRIFFGTMAVLGGLQAAAAAAVSFRDASGHGIAFCVSGVLVWGLSLLVGRVRARKEWLLVHAKGLAMVGSHLTGELSWEEVKTIGNPKAQGIQLGHESGPASSGNVVVIETVDGARIAVADYYDATLDDIVSLCRYFMRQD